jgi:hypothetical protein
MPIEHFIIAVYLLVSKAYNDVTKGIILRKRGFDPKLSDEEVITMDIVGEFLGIDTDKGIWSYFKTHWQEWFPKLGSRANYVKQSANLWYIKQKMEEKFIKEGNGFTDNIHIVDGFPMPVCKISRSYRCKSFKGLASYGYCAAKDEKYYGFHGHLLINYSGLITAITFTPANGSEREAVWDLVDNVEDIVIGDKGYIGQKNQEELYEEKHIKLVTPLRKNMKDDREPKTVQWLMKTRRVIETVIGQLSERFHIEKVRARDLWHLSNRVIRKVTAHIIACLLNLQMGREPLQFDGLVIP